VYLWDRFTFRKHRFTPDARANWMFLARKTGRTPARTCGKLSRGADGLLVFCYRPWLMLKEKSLTLPLAQYAVGRGLIWSEIVRLEGEAARSALLLPPRYRSHEEELVKVYSLAGVRPIGLRAVFRWIKEALGLSAQPAAPVVPK
jgi:hypothetical protein